MLDCILIADTDERKAEIERLQEERNTLTRKATESQSLRELGYKVGEVVRDIEVISSSEEDALFQRVSQISKEITKYKCLIADEIIYNGNKVFDVAAQAVDDFYTRYNQNRK